MDKIANNIELVSLHIPKTAGTSFRSILLENVSERNFAKVDIFNSGRIKVNDQYFSGNKLHRKVKAIHGHFPYRVLHDRFAIAPNAQLITWLRNPVERVLSNYYFLKSILQARINEQEDENLLERFGKTLEEFVSHPENQNVMSNFLEEAPLESFAFIGIQDEFETELVRLKNTMNWVVANKEHNTTQNKRSKMDHSLETIAFIEKHNQRDIELYNKVLKLNGKSIIA